MKSSLCVAASAIACTLSWSSGVAMAEAASSCDAVGGNIQSGNVCHLLDVTPDYVIDLRFGTDYPDDQAVGAYLTQERDRVIGLAKVPGAQMLPYGMNVTSKSYRSGQAQRTTVGYGTNEIPNTPPTGTRSLVLTVLEEIPTGPVNTGFKAFTFDFDQNRPVTLSNLFAPGVDPVAVLAPLVNADLTRQFHIRGFAPSAAVHDPASYQNFVITDDAVTFFFDAATLLPAGLGGINSVISRTKLPPLQL